MLKQKKKNQVYVLTRWGLMKTIVGLKNILGHIISSEPGNHFLFHSFKSRSHLNI